MVAKTGRTGSTVACSFLWCGLASVMLRYHRDCARFMGLMISTRFCFSMSCEDWRLTGA